MYDLQANSVKVHAFVHPLMALDLEYVANANDWNPERTVREALRIGLTRLERDAAEQFFCQDQILEYVREAIVSGRHELFFDLYDDEDDSYAGF